MKKNKVMLLVGLALTCQMTLTACHTNKDSGSHEPKTKQVTKKVAKKKKSKKVHKDHKGVAGIDFPTDDGFILTKDSKIIAKKDNGIVIEHGDHTHFIFYADLKGSAFEYLIPKGADVTKPEVARASEHQTSHATNGHHHYEFNPADIVAEDALGYTVRHGDHFHYILKSSLTGPVNHKPQTQLTISKPSVNQRFSGVHYPTDDGFLFDGTGIVGRTALGLLVDHNGHTHVVTYDSIRNTQWSHLIEAPKPQAPEAPQAPSESEALAKEIDLKKEHLAKSLGIDVNSIKVEKTEDGVVLIYPHGDHSHSSGLDEIELDKPFDPHGNPHAKDKIGMATLKKIGFDDEVIASILHANAPTPFPSKEKDMAKMKEWLATIEYINIGEIENPLQRKNLDLMPNLQVLGIGFTKIDDVTPVLQFKNLKQLWMTRTGITNYDFLKQLPSLEGIDISQNGISDLSFLKDFLHYKVISAAGNDLTDISILAKMPNLESLNLDYNKLTDISALKNAKHLTAVSLEHNTIKDLSALSDKDKLVRLYVSHNPKVDLTTLKSNALQELTVQESDVSDLSFLKNMTALETLTIDNNVLTNLKGLETNQSIKTLSANKNKVTSLGLGGLQTSLSVLNLQNNHLSSLEGINDYKALETINVNGNEIATLKLSKPNHAIKEIYADNNHIPADELNPAAPGEFPKGIVENFKAAEGGSLAGNAPETAHQDSNDEHADHDHDHEHEHNHEHADHDHEHDHADHDHEGHDHDHDHHGHSH
ncbi:leucine-rich repeat domain-containing protein [Streptococcus phocae subsp. phocae]